ncbi:sterol carrier family protein [Actinoallomurus sp. NBC_01490]|uniref:sterol carrier family protein n=1 Tax=Actinoallomurus sp. NBC_01490 TaxID=2903557 RepID=UPI002E32D9DB|nr:sterol carrier family protein [Actinoallomurus sp. NBC_01490]
MARLRPERLRAALDDQLNALGRTDEPPPPEARLEDALVTAVLATYDAGEEPVRTALRVTVRLLLERLATDFPGRSVEVRVPPYAAVQCVEGPRHTRGTPPNVIETDAKTWIMLATGRTTWDEAHDRISASGERADLSSRLPVRPYGDHA